MTPRPANISISRALASLFLLLVTLFLTGGSVRASEPHVGLLRASAAIAIALAVTSLEVRHVRHFRSVAWLTALLVALTVAHLVPLPPAVWTELPGRSLVAEIDQAAGLGGQWRPMSIAPSDSLNALMALAVPVTVLALGCQLNFAQNRLVLVAVLGLLGATALMGIAQAADIPLTFYDDPSPVAGAFANRNHQAAALAMIFPVAIAAGKSFSGRSGRARAIQFLALSLSIVAVPLILVTGSRSGLFIGCAALALCPWVWGQSDQKTLVTLKGVSVLAAGSIVAALIALTIATARDVAIDRLDASPEGLRWIVWESIVQALPTFWPWGSGVGTYAVAYQIVEPAALLRPTFSNHAHNEYLEVAFTAGLPGLLLMGAALWMVLKAALAGSRAGSDGLFTRLGVALIALIGLASLTDYPARTPIISGLLALFALWACSARGFPEDLSHKEVRT